jgi:DUF1365 family protein
MRKVRCAVVSFASGVYVGELRHRRFTPRSHAFRHGVFFLYLDLDELPRVFARRWLWSVDRPNLCAFRREDYYGDPTRSLKDCVLERVERETGRRPAGPVRLLTHLRTLGHCFNPVSFYYCYAADGRTLEAILAEITNTPWMERYQYVLPVTDAERERHEFGFGKAFHVSPFLPMNMHYEWMLSTPASRLHVHMVNRVTVGADPAFDATLTLSRRELTGRTLARALLRYPGMSLFVVFWIHWHALRLWFKRVPFFSHPAKIRRNDR